MGHYRISVCISVYNGEKHLRRCLDSVVAQRQAGIEIILVDDGSTDDTPNIMRGYGVQHPNIKIIEKEHSGLAQGRCTGVKNASGEYVTFLDADDYLIDGAYETVLQFVETTKADIYEFQTIREGYYSKSPYTGVMSTKQVLRDYFNGTGIPVNYWLRVFRRELFNDRVFPKEISLYEDVYAFPCLLYNAETIAFIEKPLHVHTKEKASIMNSFYSDKNGREAFDKQKTLLKSIPHIENNIGKDVIDGEYKDCFDCYKARIYRDFIFMDINGISYSDKLDAVLSTLELKITRQELENLIEKNIETSSTTGRMIRTIGLRNAYLLYRLGNRIRGRD